MRLFFIGAAHEVTGSCTLLRARGKNILIDCGMEQGVDTYENATLPVLPFEVDAILLTHAHIDHSGKIPAMAKSGFNGPIYSTEATHALCEIMLRDSAHIQEMEARWRNRKGMRAGDDESLPVYTTADAEKALSQFVTFPYEKEIEIFKGITISFIDAGHLLGSSSISIRVQEGDDETTILFSGDVGNTARPLISDPQKPKRADYVIIESTYGDRLHGERKDYLAQLTDIIQRTLDRGGNVVIPSFAVGRTQELLYLLRIIKEEGRITGHEGFPVYIDSPLAIEATELYSSGLEGYYDSEALELLANGINPIKFKDLRLSITSDDSRAINESATPRVIISASGMCEAGRIRHHLKHNLWRAESTILFVGYQSVGTLGRKIIDGERFISLFGEDIRVNAEIAQMDGISGHADRDMLLSWLGNLEKAPRLVFVNHGNDTVCDELATKIQDSLGYKAVAPHSGDIYDLSSSECVEKGLIVSARSPRITNARRRSSVVFERLQMAGNRLLSVIEQNRGGANKDLARFTSQIEALCDKYEMKEFLAKSAENRERHTSSTKKNSKKSASYKRGKKKR